MFTHWGTVDGDWVEKDCLSHDHLSNIYYYVNFIYREGYPDETRQLIQKELDDRFEGTPLPYKPFYDWELQYIKHKGMVKLNGDIIYQHGHTSILLGNVG